MKVISHIILFIIAWLLILPLTIINFFLVHDKGYFLSTARSIDVWANYEFRTLWNFALIKDGVAYYKFGIKYETISSALGKNKRIKSLSKAGKLLVFILDTIDKNHTENAIT